MPSTGDPTKQTPRDRPIRLLAEKGRLQPAPRAAPPGDRFAMGWQQATNYGRRSLAETAIGRYKHLIGPKLRARTPPGQQGEVALAVHVLNRMIRAAKPASVRIS